MTPLTRTSLILLVLHATVSWAGDTRLEPSGPVRLPAAEAKALRKALADAQLLSQDEDVGAVTVSCMQQNAPPARFYEATAELPKNETRRCEAARPLQALCRLVARRFPERAEHAAGSTGWTTPPLRVRGKGTELVIEYGP